MAGFLRDTVYLISQSFTSCNSLTISSSSNFITSFSIVSSFGRSSSSRKLSNYNKSCYSWSIIASLIIFSSTWLIKLLYYSLAIGISESEFYRIES